MLSLQNVSVRCQREGGESQKTLLDIIVIGRIRHRWQGLKQANVAQYIFCDIIYENIAISMAILQYAPEMPSLLIP
jgi:hypothetical protein